MSQYGLSIKMNESEIGTPIYRMNEISNMTCDREINKFADVDTETIKEFELKNRDVLFNRTNSQKFVGRTGIFQKFSNKKFIFASYLVRIRTNKEKVLPEYLTAFLNTKYGISELKRRARKSINQSNINPRELGRIEIPLLEMNFQQLIMEKFKKSFDLSLKYEKAIKNAEYILLEEFKSSSLECRHILFYIKNYSDIRSARRMDADCFQPKYKKIVNAIKKYKGGWESVKNLTAISNQKFMPEKNKVYKYLELANIGDSGNILGCTEATGKNLPTRARRKVLTNDVIVSSVEGSLENVALIPEEYNNALCSTGFHVLRSSTLSPECLFIFMKSILGQSLLKKGCSGTILAAIGEDEISQLPLPLLEAGLQKKINNKVSQAALAHQHSKNLLQTAKRAVEIAIEKGETKAKAWLEKQE